MFKFKSKQLKKIRLIAKTNSTSQNFILGKFREETMELQKALQFQGMPEIVDEIADVLIMIEQFSHVNKLDKKISKRIDYKLTRTREYLRDPAYANGVTPKTRLNPHERR